MKTEMCCLRAQSLLTFPVCVLEVSCAWCHSQQSRDSLCFLKDFWIADTFPLDHSYFCWDAQPTSLHLKGCSWPSGGLFSYDFIREDSLDLYPELNLSHPVLYLQIISSIYIYECHSMQTHVWGLSHSPLQLQEDPVLIHTEDSAYGLRVTQHAVPE